jgi:hypothetical protein
MGEKYSFEIAAEALKRAPQPDGHLGAQKAEKYKDCSAKHHKVDLLEKEHKASEAEEADAAMAAGAALDEYKIWKNDQQAGPKYYAIYQKRHHMWLEARTRRLKLNEKLQDAKQAAWACEGQNAFK